MLLRYWIGFTPQRGPKKPWYFAVISAIVMQSCRKRPPVSPSFPMFVPSQSWQMIGLYIQMAHKRERERSRSPYRVVIHVAVVCLEHRQAYFLLPRDHTLEDRRTGSCEKASVSVS
jgi:hypothetical protein